MSTFVSLAPVFVFTRQNSSDRFLTSLFPEEVNLKQKKKASSTAGNRIKKSCNELVDKLMECTPHYCRYGGWGVRVCLPVRCLGVIAIAWTQLV